MLVVGLDHVQVAAPARPGVEDEARAFYRELLGLREIEKPSVLKAKGGLWCSLGQGELHVGLEEQFQPACKAHPALLVSKLAAVRERLAEAGVQIAEAEAISGANRCYVYDPFGNRIELIERI